MGPDGGVKPLFQVPGAGQPAVGVAAVAALAGVWAGLGDEPVPVVVVAARKVVRDHGVKPVELSPRVQVAPAYVYAVVAVSSQYRRQRVRFEPLDGGVADQAAVIAALAAVQHAARAGGGWYFGIGIGEVRPAVDPGVEVGRLEDGMPGQANVVAAVLIGGDQEDVRPLTCHEYTPDSGQGRATSACRTYDAPGRCVKARVPGQRGKPAPGLRTPSLCCRKAPQIG